MRRCLTPIAMSGVVNNGDGTATRTLGASAVDGDKVPFDFRHDHLHGCGYVYRTL